MIYERIKRKKDKNISGFDVNFDQVTQDQNRSMAEEMKETEEKKSETPVDASAYETLYEFRVRTQQANKKLCSLLLIGWAGGVTQITEVCGSEEEAEKWVRSCNPKPDAFLHLVDLQHWEPDLISRRMESPTMARDVAFYELLLDLLPDSQAFVVLNKKDKFYQNFQRYQKARAIAEARRSREQLPEAKELAGQEPEWGMNDLLRSIEAQFESLAPDDEHVNVYAITAFDTREVLELMEEVKRLLLISSYEVDEGDLSEVSPLRSPRRRDEPVSSEDEEGDDEDDDEHVEEGDIKDDEPSEASEPERNVPDLAATSAAAAATASTSLPPQQTSTPETTVATAQDTQ